MRISYCVKCEDLPFVSFAKAASAHLLYLLNLLIDLSAGQSAVGLG